MMKDHNITPNLLTKEDVISLVRIVNDKKKLPLRLDYDRFVNFIIQTAYNISSRSPINASLTLLESLVLFHNYL